MMNNWEETTLKEIANITMGQSPSSESYNLDGDGLPFYQGVTEFGDKYISIKSYTNAPTKIIEANSILFSVRAPVGRVNFTKNKCCIGRGNAGLMMKNGEQEFLYYLLMYLEKSILKNTTGTVFDSISGAELRKFPILVPESKKEQKEIGAVLSSLDDKIELLRKENETLEKITQTIFKEWFVNFTIDGKKLKLENGIPEGWRYGKLSDLGVLVTDYVANGSFASLKENVNLYADKKEYALFIRNTDLKSGFLEKIYVDEHSYNFLSKTKLFGGEIIISNVGDVGSVHLCPLFNFPMTLGNNVIMLKSENNQGYLFTLFRSRIGKFSINSITGGSAQPKFNKTDFRNLKILIPEKNILENFNFVSWDLYMKILNNNSQIQFLARLRDTLLPKLMSGEVEFIK